MELIKYIQNHDIENSLRIINECDLKYTDINGDTALIWACRYNMSEVALAIIATGQSNISYRGYYGNTALIHACYNNMSEVALALINKEQSNLLYLNDFGHNVYI